MRRIIACLIIVVAVLAGCTSVREGTSLAAIRYQLAPTGKIRAAISVGPTANAFRATLAPETGRPRGVPVDLANALGEQLGLPVEVVSYTNYVDLLAAAPLGDWDVTFLPPDEARMKVLDFGPAYVDFDFTYIVPDGSPIRAQADVDRSGVRIAVAEGSITARNREQALKNAALVRFKTLAEIRDQLRARKVDAAAAGRETLTALAAQVPGSRVLDGHYHTEGVAIAVPKGRPVAVRFVTDFIESAKASGVVRRALDDAGLKDAVVAPIRTK